MQRSFWFLREIFPGAAEHCIAVALPFRCEPDVSAVERACEVLLVHRGVFSVPAAANDGEPGNAVHRVYEHDAGDIDDARLTEWLEDTAHDAVEPVRADLLQIHLYRRNSGETAVLAVVHHSVADFWSITPLVHELEMLYAEQTGSQTAPLPELVDFVRRYSWVNGSRVSTHAVPNGDAAQVRGAETV